MSRVNLRLNEFRGDQAKCLFGRKRLHKGKRLGEATYLVTSMVDETGNSSTVRRSVSTVSANELP
jgi:hypothetical protein